MSAEQCFGFSVQCRAYYVHCYYLLYSVQVPMYSVYKRVSLDCTKSGSRSKWLISSLQMDGAGHSLHKAQLLLLKVMLSDSNILLLVCIFSSSFLVQFLESSIPQPKPQEECLNQCGGCVTPQLCMPSKSLLSPKSPILLELS